MHDWMVSHKCHEPEPWQMAMDKLLHTPVSIPNFGTLSCLSA